MYNFPIIICGHKVLNCCYASSYLYACLIYYSFCKASIVPASLTPILSPHPTPSLTVYTHSHFFMHYPLPTSSETQPPGIQGLVVNLCATSLLLEQLNFKAKWRQGKEGRWAKLAVLTVWIAALNTVASCACYCHPQHFEQPAAYGHPPLATRFVCY